MTARTGVERFWLAKLIRAAAAVNSKTQIDAPTLIAAAWSIQNHQSSMNSEPLSSRNSVTNCIPP